MKSEIGHVQAYDVLIDELDAGHVSKSAFGRARWRKSAGQPNSNSICGLVVEEENASTLKADLFLKMARRFSGKMAQTPTIF